MSAYGKTYQFAHKAVHNYIVSNNIANGVTWQNKYGLRGRDGLCYAEYGQTDVTTSTKWTNCFVEPAGSTSLPGTQDVTDLLTEAHIVTLKCPYTACYSGIDGGQISH